MSGTYWQIAAGSIGRNYIDYFIKFGMAFVGGEVQIATMREVQKGDFVAIKNGLYQIVAAGELVERGEKANREIDIPWTQQMLTGHWAFLAGCCQVLST